jgi:hypothetical protein
LQLLELPSQLSSSWWQSESEMQMAQLRQLLELLQHLAQLVGPARATATFGDGDAADGAAS